MVSTWKLIAELQENLIVRDQTYAGSDRLLLHPGNEVSLSAEAWETDTHHRCFSVCSMIHYKYHDIVVLSLGA